ncbi:MAG: ATP-dependent zinc metalloprotease FtsH, partial [Candidatus Liberibacter asiaticus]
LHKATIIPRGRALGMVMQLPEADRHSTTYVWMTSRLTILMGGRVAEEFTFGEDNVTSGAMSDIEYATKLARVMVTQFGFSNLLGKVSYEEGQQEALLSHPVSRPRSISEETAQKIDKEVFRLIEEAYQKAKSIIQEKNDNFVAIAEALLEYETLSGKEIASLIRGEKISRPSEDDGVALCASVPQAGVQEAEVSCSEEKDNENIDSSNTDDLEKEDTKSVQ